MERYRNDDIDHSARIRSPRHPEVMMMRRFYSPARNIEIDECPKSGGIWLDPGELSHLRELFPTEEERNAAVHTFVADVLSDAGMERTAEDAYEDATRPKNNTTRLGALLRWIGGVRD
jgi:Zn-finger nucleic acid-binding protein